MKIDKLTQALEEVGRLLALGDLTTAIDAMAMATAECQAAPTLDASQLRRAGEIYQQCLAQVDGQQQRMQQQAQGLAQSQRAHNAYLRSSGSEV